MRPRLFCRDRSELIGAAFAILVVGPLAWMALDRAPPLRILSVTGSAAPVDRLGALHLRYEAVYLRPDCAGEGRRRFVDVTHRAIWTEPYAFRTGIGFDGRPVQIGKAQVLPPVAVTVPLDLSPGPATYENDVRFYCNPLQKMLGRAWPWLSIGFRTPSVGFTVAASVAARPEPSTHIFAPDAPGLVAEDPPP